MALVVDPDDLSRLATETTVTDFAISLASGVTASLDSAGANLPAMVQNDYVRLTGFTDPANNGLWQITDASPTTTQADASKITGDDPVNEGAASRSIKTAIEIFLDLEQRDFWLFTQGAISNDGVTLQCVYSFFKQAWKDDADLIPHPFPAVAITPEQFEFQDNWTPGNDTTRKLIRTGGWSEIDNLGVLQRQYAGIITLGTFEDSGADIAYYAVGNDPTDTGAKIPFDFAGPVNEAVLTYNQVTPADATPGFAITGTDTITRADGGDWAVDGYVIGGEIVIANAEDAGNDGSHTLLTVASGVDGAITVSSTLTNNAADTTMTAAISYRNDLTIRLRVRDGDANGKSFAQSDLAAIGVTALTNKVERFPVGNATDLKITSTDASITGGGPWDQILIRYFDQAFTQDIGATPRSFGIVVDVGTFSGVDGASATSVTFTSAEGNIATTWDGGTLEIHEGTDKGTHTISSSTATTFVLSGALTATESNLSFTAQRSTPVTATTVQIYEKVQWSLRQASDIDVTDQVVAGDTADELLAFVGDTLKAGSALPVNPNAGGSGVAILGFDSNDTNDLVFVDNTAVERTFPFVAAGTIAFNANLVSDTAPKYWMFYEYTERFTGANFGISAVTLNEGTLDSSVTDLTTELADGDYIALSGFVAPENNGVYVLTGTPAGGGPYTATVRKLDGTTLIVETEAATVSMDKNPINSPDTIIVDNNAGTDITGAISSGSVAFDFDYDGNVQGGRTASTSAAIILRAIGLETGQFVEASGTITNATGLAFSLVAALERNFNNP